MNNYSKVRTWNLLIYGKHFVGKRMFTPNTPKKKKRKESIFSFLICHVSLIGVWNPFQSPYSIKLSTLLKIYLDIFLVNQNGNFFLCLFLCMFITLALLFILYFIFVVLMKIHHFGSPYIL